MGPTDGVAEGLAPGSQTELEITVSSIQIHITKEATVPDMQECTLDEAVWDMTHSHTENHD